MGVNRDLKKATESYWAKKLSQDELLAEGKRLRQEHWIIQKDAGIDIIPSNDFSFYDHVLDHIQFFGVRVKLNLQQSPNLTSMLCRLSLRNMQNITLNQLTSFLQWEEAYRSRLRMVQLQLMFQVW